MEVWKKKELPGTIKAAFDRIELIYKDRDYHFQLCSDDAKNSKIQISFPTIASFRWSDDCFDAVSHATPKSFPEIGNGQRGAYPLMLVEKSHWLPTVDEDQAASFGEFTHYKIFSIRDTYDLIVCGEPKFAVLAN